VKKCSGSLAGTKRLVIAGTTDSRLANFGASNGSLSFSGFFLSAALQGNTLYDCFSVAREAIVALNVPASAPQIPWLDDNGDGVPSPLDGTVARQRVFGNLPAFGFVIPEITAARPDARIAAPADFQLWLEMGPGTVKQAEAVVSYADASQPEGVPITSFKLVPLVREGSTNRWSGTLSASDIAGDGLYQILYTAVRDDGFGVDLASRPVHRTLQVGRTAVQVENWSLY